MVDGLSRTKAFLKITFPLLAPGLVASAVYAFLQAWNEFTVALVIMTEEQSRTLPLWLRGFVQASASRETDWGQVMAASTLVAAARHHLLPRRPGPDEQRARRRGGEGMSLAADVAATLQPGFPGTSVPDWLVRAHAEGAGLGLPLRRQRRRAATGWRPCAPTCTSGCRACSSPSTRRAATSRASTTRPGSTAVGNARARPARRPRDDPRGRRPASAPSSPRSASASTSRPSVDVNSSPDNPVIGVRSFGADPAPRRPPRAPRGWRACSPPGSRPARSTSRATATPSSTRTTGCPRVDGAARRAPRARARAVPGGRRRPESPRS